MERCPVVIVEGPIGSGKSTLTRELGEALGPNTLTLLEPDEKHEANPYLSDYYEDSKRWSFTMQAHMLGMRFRMHLLAQWHALQRRGAAVMDRSYYGDTAFARLQLKLGLMSQREFETYQAMYHAMTASVLYPTVCIRVLVEPELCNARISRRMEIEEGRKCEKAIDLDYLRGLEREIDHMVSVLRSQGVTIIDMPWDMDRDSPADRKQAVQSLASRIKSVEPLDFFLDLHRRTL